MTLIINEIHMIDGFKDSFVISAADRRLTCPRIKDPKKRYRKGKKLFKIDYLNATVSYWGNCVVLNTGRYELLSSWIPNFIRSQCKTKDIKSFVFNVRDALNQTMPSNELAKAASGFHIVGYRKDGAPDFWHFSNCNWNGTTYVNMQSTFGDPTQDFLAKDARRWGWDGKDITSVVAKNDTFTYRNGEFKVHEAIWDILDIAFVKIFRLPNFQTPNTAQEYKEDVKFKLDLISRIYSRYAVDKIVGGPFDVEVLMPKGGQNVKFIN